MKSSEEKAKLTSSIGSLLTSFQPGDITMAADFGSFHCSVEVFDNFRMVRRSYETASDPISIAFSCDQPGVQMIFSLDGQSVFNDRIRPFVLAPVSHCINFFNQYNCSNLMDGHSRQHDITFSLKKSFYGDLIANHLSASEDRLPAMILQQQEFNTINEHIPADPGILGMLKNIIDCPFHGEMRSAFIREHIRALLTLQLFHFSPIVTGKTLRYDGKISKRDEEILHEVKKYLDNNFLQASSIDSLTKHFGINDFKLKHGFKLLFDTSPMRYLQYKRLEYALVLLRDTARSIKNIANEIGYSHAANFTAAFTKTFGNCPLHYRAGKQLGEEKVGELYS